MELVETVVAGRLTDPAHRWRLHLAGRLHLLPEATRHALKTVRGRRPRCVSMVCT